jgi:hypothetical protein
MCAVMRQRSIVPLETHEIPATLSNSVRRCSLQSVSHCKTDCKTTSGMGATDGGQIDYEGSGHD